MVGICRLCATIRKTDMLVDIKDDTDEICQNVREFCQVNIEIEDELPKCVCSECVYSLHMASVFIKKVREAQEALQVLLKERHILEKSKSMSHTLVVTKSDMVTAGKRFKGSAENQSNSTESPESMKSDSMKSEDSVLLTVFDSEEPDIQADNHRINKNTICTNAKGDEVFEINMREAQLSKTDENNGEVEYLVQFDSDDEEVMEEEHLIEEKIQDEKHISASKVNNWKTYEWRCYLCSFGGSSLLVLQQHAFRVHGVKAGDLQYKCNDCQKICPRYYSFVNHVRLRHHRALMLCCDLCGLYCSDYEELDKHRRYNCFTIAEWASIVFCPVCGKGFLNKSAMKLHERTQHGCNEKLHVCVECGRQFKRIGALRAHQRIHTGVKEYTCELCGRAFRQKVNLDVHLLSHIPEKPYSCNICKKSFKTSTNLEKHNLVHTDIKHFRCEFCSKLFRTKDAKLSHERTHTGELPYECEYCQKRFRFRSTLLTHLNVHTGRRPYACNPCNHTFTNWSNYNKHMKRRHSSHDKAAISNTPKEKSSDVRLKSEHTTKAVDPSKTKTKPKQKSEKVDIVSYIYDEQDDVFLRPDSGAVGDGDTARRYMKSPTECNEET